MSVRRARLSARGVLDTMTMCKSGVFQTLDGDAM